MTAKKASSADPRVELSPPFVDERGLIQPLVDDPIASALLITGRKGSVRGNHYHRSDWHYCYVVSGRMKYYWREADGRSEPSVIDVKEGEMVFSPPMTEHAFRFLEDTTFIALARNPRSQDEYEGDIVRVDLVLPE